VDRAGGGHGQGHSVTMHHPPLLSSSNPLYMSNRNRSNPNTGTIARIPRDIIPTLRAAPVDGCVSYPKPHPQTLSGL
jgi:hypothetical protein